jgi:hypothetical protein
MTTKCKIALKSASMLTYAFVGMLSAGVAHAGTIENLERERSMVIDIFLDPDLEPGDRQARITDAMPRMVDLERMVLRDDSLKGRNTPTVRKAFNNYDLTFIMHASSEKGRTPLDVWLDQVGISTDSLMAARIGQRW